MKNYFSRKFLIVEVRVMLITFANRLDFCRQIMNIIRMSNDLDPADLGPNGLPRLTADD